LQSVMSKIKTVTGNVEFEATETGITTTPSFDKLTSAADLKIEQKADVSLPELTSLTGALNIVNDTKITSISAPKLTKMGSLTNATFSKVSMFDMSSLVRLPAALTLSVDSGTVDFSSLITTTDATPVAESGFKIDISGATIVKAPLITGGELDMSHVDEPNFPVWEGHTDSEFDRASKVVLPKLTGDVQVNLSTFAPKATYFHMIGNEYNDTTDSTDNSTFPTFTVGASSATPNSNLETLIIGGDVKTVNVSNAADLISYTHDGASHDVTFDNNDEITSVTFDHTTTLNSGTKGAAATKGSLSIQGNASLTSVSAPALDDISSLTIKSNPELDTVSFPVLNSVGTLATGGVTNVDISSNDLVIDNVQQKSDPGVSPVVAKKITSADFQQFKAYLDAALLKVGTSGKVYVVADDVLLSTAANGDVTEQPSGDHEIVNYDPSVKSNSTGGVAEVEEFQITTDATTLTVGNYVSTITNGGGSIYYDLLTWAADETEMSNLGTAGVTVSVGKGNYSGDIAVTAGSTITGSTYYEWAVGGQTITGTTGAASGWTVLSTVNKLFDDANTNTILTATKAFDLYTTTTGLVFSGTAHGSAASAFAIGALKLYETASKLTPVTTATTTVTGPARIETEGYIRITSKTLGTAGSITGTVSAGNKLTASGTYTGASATGDDEAIVAPKDGTDSTVTAAQILAARVDMTAFL